MSRFDDGIPEITPEEFHRREQERLGVALEAPAPPKQRKRRNNMASGGARRVLVTIGDGSTKEYPSLLACAADRGFSQQFLYHRLRYSDEATIDGVHFKYLDPRNLNKKGGRRRSIYIPRVISEEMTKGSPPAGNLEILPQPSVQHIQRDGARITMFYASYDGPNTEQVLSQLKQIFQKIQGEE